jgi:sporulation protein YlmC with PRC-barrel domain/CBS domain-containing protein
VTAQNGGSVLPDSGTRSTQVGINRYYLLTELLDKPVSTAGGVTVGRLNDLEFIDDPKYGEVTGVVVRRPFGRPPLRVPWTEVIQIDPRGTTVRDPSGGMYAEFEPLAGQILLRDTLLDKRILDTYGVGVDVVYDLQLLLAGGKLFVVAADVSGRARRRRLGLVGLRGRTVPDGGASEARIPWRYVQPIGQGLTSTSGDLKLTVTREAARDVRPEDLADVLEELSREERIKVFGTLDSETAAHALEETEPRVQREILADAGSVRAVKVFSHLSPPAIADIISVLPHEDAQGFLSLLPRDVGEKVRVIIAQHDVVASSIASSRFLGFAGHLTAEEAFQRFRKEAPGCPVTMYIYIVDAQQKLRGVVDINELLQADPMQRLEKIMTRNVVTVAPSTEHAEIAALFRRYHFRALPVVDESGRMVGVVREKDAFILDAGDESMHRRL